MTLLAATDGLKRNSNDRVTEVLSRNKTRSAVAVPASLPAAVSDDFYDLNNKMMPNAKLVRAKRGARGYGPRPRKLGRRRPPYLPARLPPIARRRFPKRPGKGKFHPKPHGPPPNSQYGPPVGFFVMNINNEIVHKSKDLGDIPPRYLDKIIPPSFISDSPPNIYALEHDEEPPLGLGESKEVVPYQPTNSYGVPVQTQQLDSQQYYPYPPAPTVEANNVPQSTETRPHTHGNQINTYRAQSETHYEQEQPPVVYHPPFQKKNKKKKKKQNQYHQQQNQQYHQEEFALQPDSPKNSYPVSSYDAPLSYVPAANSPKEVHSHHYPVQHSQPPQHPPQPPPQKVRPSYNVGQSYVESYSRDSNEEAQVEAERKPPQLPAIYNQNDFKTVNKSNNKKKVVYQVNTSYEDFDDQSDTDDHGLALEYPPSSEEEITELPSAFNFGARHKKRKPPKFDFIDSYEDSSISQEVYHHTTPFAINTRPFKKSQPITTTSTERTTRNHRPRSTTKDPLFDILDTEDLRNAFQSGRHRYKLQNYNKNKDKEPENFVLLSSKNTPSSYNRGTPKTPFQHSSSAENNFDRPPSSLETDYESYEIAERDFGLRKREFVHKRKTARKDEAAARMDTSAEKIKFSDGRRPDDFVKATTMKPYSRFNPDVQFTKTFSSKIEQPREASIWNGQAIPGNHKITKRGGSSA